jgi:hypothetical protein
MNTQNDHWKAMTDPKYLGAWDFVPFEGRDIILTIASVRQEEVTGQGNKKQKRPIIYWAEPGFKPMICNITNGKVISSLVGGNRTSLWTGKKIQLYVDPNVDSFGKKVEGIRVRPTLPR